MFYAYFYLSRIHYLNVYSVSLFDLSNYRGRELYHQSNLHTCSSFIYLTYLVWMVIIPVTSITSFLLLDFLWHWTNILQVMVLSLTCGTTFCSWDWWSTLPQYWQGTHDSFTLLIWSKSLVSTMDFCCSYLCLFCLYSVSNLEIYCSICNLLTCNLIDENITLYAWCHKHRVTKRKIIWNTRQWAGHRVILLGILTYG